MFLPPKYEFQTALDYVKLRQNCAEVSRSKKTTTKKQKTKKQLKCKHNIKKVMTRLKHSLEMKSF